MLQITSVEPEDASRPVPKGETVIDGQGGTLVPGLHDMHSHTTLQSNLFNLAAGVTAVRDQGNYNEELLGWIDAAGLRVLGRIDTRPRHAKAHDAGDALHAARSAEVTSLWRLAAA